MFYKFYDTVLVHLIGGKTIRVKANALSFLEELKWNITDL